MPTPDRLLINFRLTCVPRAPARDRWSERDGRCERARRGVSFGGPADREDSVRGHAETCLGPAHAKPAPTTIVSVLITS